MKKAVALIGTQRKRNTQRVLLEIKPYLEKNHIALEIIDLYGVTIQACIGCEQCILQGRCVLTDDVSDIMQRLLDADGIILASPVYLKNISGRLKTFLDRTCVWYHRPALIKKPVLAVATTKGSGLKATLSYLNSIAVQWGAIPAGKIGRSIFNENKSVTEKEVEPFIRLIQHPEKHVPNLNQLFNFEVQKAMALSLNDLDKNYWIEQNWANQPYFYPCKKNKISASVSHAFGKFLQKKMRPH